jgi:hypothetical protein
MPIANQNRRCTARARSTGNRCLNPVRADHDLCSFHLNRHQHTIKTGKHHPNFKHGLRTLESVRQYRGKMLELDQIENIARDAGLIIGPRRRGRKPNQDED